MPSGSRSKTLQRKLSGDCASIPSGSSRKCFRLLVTMTWAPAFTAAATTCLSFSSFFIAAISGLVARHHRLRECFSHDCAEPRGSLVGHSSGIDQAPARLFEDL